MKQSEGFQSWPIIGEGSCGGTVCDWNRSNPDRALEYPHRRGEKICVVRATSTELRAFRQRGIAYIVTKSLKFISRAVVLGEEILCRRTETLRLDQCRSQYTPYYLFVIKHEICRW